MLSKITYLNQWYTRCFIGIIKTWGSENKKMGEPSVMFINKRAETNIKATIMWKSFLHIVKVFLWFLGIQWSNSWNLNRILSNQPNEIKNKGKINLEGWVIMSSICRWSNLWSYLRKFPTKIIEENRSTYLGNASKHHVLRVSGNATLMPEVNGECRITPPHSNLDAKSTVGTVPMLWPYKMIFSGLMPYLVLNACHAASISLYKFFSEGFPWLTPYPE